MRKNPRLKENVDIRDVEQNSRLARFSYLKGQSLAWAPRQPQWQHCGALRLAQDIASAWVDALKEATREVVAAVVVAEVECIMDVDEDAFRFERSMLWLFSGGE